MAQILDASPYGKATAENIAAFETLINAPLPEEYRAFLLQHNGGRPIPAFFCGEGVSGSVEFLLGLGERAGEHSLARFFHEYLDRIPANLIPIGVDPRQNLICLGVREMKGVFFWKHDYKSDKYQNSDSSNAVFISVGFDEFISSLRNESIVSRLTRFMESLNESPNILGTALYLMFTIWLSAAAVMSATERGYRHSVEMMEGLLSIIIMCIFFSPFFVLFYLVSKRFNRQRERQPQKGMKYHLSTLIWLMIAAGILMGINVHLTKLQGWDMTVNKSRSQMTFFERENGDSARTLFWIIQLPLTGLALILFGTYLEWRIRRRERAEATKTTHEAVNDQARPEN